MNHEHLQLLVTRVMPYGKYKGWYLTDSPASLVNTAHEVGLLRLDVKNFCRATRYRGGS